MGKTRQQRKQDEHNLYVLQRLLALPENQFCADCNDKGPRWASVNLGVFLCIRCAGLHRNLGTHVSVVKSVTLDSWTQEHLDTMATWGNRRANARFLANGLQPHPPAHSNSEMERYIRNKYERRAYANGG
ncbi:hypothetical protein DFJ73DRAFT_639669, partial [Zopfochytrium polystomum]